MRPMGYEHMQGLCFVIPLFSCTLYYSILQRMPFKKSSFLILHSFKGFVMKNGLIVSISIKDPSSCPFLILYETVLALTPLTRRSF